MPLKVGQGQPLDAKPLADGLEELVQVGLGGPQRVLLDGAVGVRGEVAVDGVAGGDRLWADRYHGGFAAGSDELLQRHAFGNGEPAEFDQPQRFVHLGALGESLSFRHVADGEVVAPPLEAERAVVGVALLADTSHVRLLRAETP